MPGPGSGNAPEPGGARTVHAEDRRPAQPEEGTGP